jgi:hypothetical protein
MTTGPLPTTAWPQWWSPATRTAPTMSSARSPAPSQKSATPFRARPGHTDTSVQGQDPTISRSCGDATRRAAPAALGRASAPVWTPNRLSPRSTCRTPWHEVQCVPSSLTAPSPGERPGTRADLRAGIGQGGARGSPEDVEGGRPTRDSRLSGRKGAGPCHSSRRIVASSFSFPRW